MKLRPTSPAGPARPAQRTTAPAAPAPAAPARAAAPVDEVRLSPAAQALAKAHVERAYEIGQRLASGFYDRPEVRRRVLERLAGDLSDADATGE